jgi:histidine triad (HIT) family protein
VFCGIVSGSVPAFMVASEEAGIAFLDLRPVFAGHTLVIPRQHVETLTDLPVAALPGYFGLVQRVAAAVQRGMGADGTFVAMNNKISQSVPHLHTHVVPRRHKDGLRGFFWPRTKYGSDLEATEVAAKIKEAFDDA